MTTPARAAQRNWRKEKKAARKALDQQERQEKSKQIAQCLLATDAYKNAQHIAAYLCMPGEVDMWKVIKKAWAEDKQVYLPVVLGWEQPLQFAPFTPQCELAKDYYDIEIPKVDSSEYVSPRILDLVITPLVAFDKYRNRIGMGGGFYDRTFAFKQRDSSAKPQLLGVAFETQRVDGVPIAANTWDISPDAIITEKTIY